MLPRSIGEYAPIISILVSVKLLWVTWMFHWEILIIPTISWYKRASSHFVNIYTVINFFRQTLRSGLYPGGDLDWAPSLNMGHQKYHITKGAGEWEDWKNKRVQKNYHQEIQNDQQIGNFMGYTQFSFLLLKRLVVEMFLEGGGGFLRVTSAWRGGCPIQWPLPSEGARKKPP